MSLTRTISVEADRSLLMILFGVVECRKEKKNKSEEEQTFKQSLDSKPLDAPAVHFRSPHHDDTIIPERKRRTVVITIYYISLRSMQYHIVTSQSCHFRLHFAQVMWKVRTVAVMPSLTS